MITFSQLGKQGRLGNQLFQVACTVSTALSNNDSYGFYPWEYSKYFNLDFCYFDQIKFDKTYKEPCFHYSSIPYSPNMDLLGFFQSEKYFLNHKELIMDLLTPNLEAKEEEGLCGIHVRRGDYLNNPAYINLNMDYYFKAINVVKSKKYLIFSDDIEWCKKNFKGDKFLFSNETNPVNDLTDMAKRCENMIISNSSFSWWGAYLNKNPNKIIVAPQKWFGPKLSDHNTKDLLPNSWVQI